MAEPKRKILQYLKTNSGERLDSAIASGTGIPLRKLHPYLSELAAKHQIVSCYLTRYENGKKIEGISCRLAGYAPPATPGRKTRVQLKLG